MISPYSLPLNHHNTNNTYRQILPTSQTHRHTMAPTTTTTTKTTEETVCTPILRSPTIHVRDADNLPRPRLVPLSSPTWPTRSTNPPLNRSSKWTMTTTATSARVLYLDFSSKPTAHSRRWRRLCMSLCSLSIMKNSR